MISFLKVWRRLLIGCYCVAALPSLLTLLLHWSSHSPLYEYLLVVFCLGTASFLLLFVLNRQMAHDMLKSTSRMDKR